MVAELSNDTALWIPDKAFVVVAADPLSLIALEPPSDFGANTVVGRTPGRPTGESSDMLGNPAFQYDPTDLRATHPTGQGCLARSHT